MRTHLPFVLLPFSLLAAANSAPNPGVMPEETARQLPLVGIGEITKPFEVSVAP